MLFEDMPKHSIPCNELIRAFLGEVLTNTLQIVDQEGASEAHLPPS